MSDIVNVPVSTLPPEMQPYEVIVFEGGGLYVHRTVIPIKGTLIPQHSHALDHVSFIATGAARVTAGDKTSEHNAPHGVLIAAGVTHLFETLEPNTIIDCIFRVPREEE